VQPIKLNIVNIDIEICRSNTVFLEAGIEIDSLSIAFIKRQPEKMKKRNKKETTGETEIRKPEKWKIRGNEKKEN
jgi:hypothetical protein